MGFLSPTTFGDCGKSAGKAKSMGSPCSALGVETGDPLLEWVNQKYFFLVGGLPELKLPGDPDAESGRFARLIMDMDRSSVVMAGESVESASAV
jgi:hypothetical protein